MNMTHKESLRTAIAEHGDRLGNLDAMESAIRAYLDARGLVMVPREPTERPVSALNAYVCRTSWDECGRRMWRDAIAAAPDPFAEGA